ncbi:MAG: HD-GYP domain-containing protein [Lachnospiraceae bacterium]|nr:HD-GYP domain-containing protein [Lachnospiraceae bacterium]
MRYLPVEELTRGMILGQEMYDPAGLMLLARHTELDDQTIGIISRTGVPGVYIEDEFSRDAEIRDVISSEVKKSALQIVHDVFIRAEQGETVDEERIASIVSQITRQVIEDRNVICNLVNVRAYDGYTYFHSVNVAVLAGVLGAKLGLSEAELNDLITAGFLHDVGKVFIDIDIINAPRRLTAEEREVIKAHPGMGYEFLRDNYSFDQDVLLAVYEHHEWFNGEGYPRGIKGDQITLPARILKVADVYDAMTGKRSYHDPYLPSDVLEYIMGRDGMEFDPDVVAVMSRELCLYPVGCEVELSDGRRALVIENHKGAIQRPKVKIYDSGEEIDLASDRKSWNLTIVKLFL